MCRFPYEINPALLHGGKNFGSITLETMYEVIRVTVEAHGVPVKEKDSEYKRYGRYLSLRLAYEAQNEKEDRLKTLMAEELEQLRMSGGPSALLSLAQAELMAVLGRADEARVYLSECKDKIYESRMENPQWYCLYEYAAVLVDKDPERHGGRRPL